MIPFWPNKPESSTMTRQRIEEVVRASLEQYLQDLRGTEPHELHELFLSAAEKPVLEVVLRHAGDNQSLAAQWLGINRNTLRRKLREHQIRP